MYSRRDQEGPHSLLTFKSRMFYRWDRTGAVALSYWAVLCYKPSFIRMLLQPFVGVNSFLSQVEVIGMIMLAVCDIWGTISFRAPSQATNNRCASQSSGHGPWHISINPQCLSTTCPSAKECAVFHLTLERSLLVICMS